MSERVVVLMEFESPRRAVENIGEGLRFGEGRFNALVRSCGYRLAI